MLQAIARAMLLKMLLALTAAAEQQAPTSALHLQPVRHASGSSQCDNAALVDGDAPGKFSPARREFLLQDSTGSFAHWLFNVTAGGNMASSAVQSAVATGIAGDWDGDGWSGVGYYEGGSFYLRDDSTDGPVDHSFSFGPRGEDVLPIAGDWLGRGSDSVGVYIRSSATVMLLLDLHGGSTNITFQFGPPGNTWWPVAGDWTGCGKSTIGLYDPVSSTFFLRTENTAGPADLTVQYGAPDKQACPVVGRWKGSPFP
jgi:hypothetical protein